MRVTTADDIARMLGKFRGNVKYTDAPDGFFGFVRETFEQLRQEEEHAAQWSGEDVADYPSFGHKDDTYEDVVRQFYSAWNGFSTKKSFAWKDQYRLSEAPDRRYRRAMEKENQKLRDAGIREFNDAVRTLLMFVKKRDPRYAPNTQSADDMAKAQREATKAQAARARAAREAQMDDAVPEWATRREPDEFEEDEEEEIETELYECVACNKTFKSDRQYEAHEKSKKHQKAIQALKRKMQKDNAKLNLDKDALSSGAITPVDDEGLSEDIDDANGLGSSYADVAEDVKNLDINKNTSNKDEEGWSSDEADDSQDTKPQTKATPATQAAPAPDTDTDTESDDEYASRSDIEARLASFRHSENPSGANADDESTSPPTAEPTPAEPKLGKAAQKRAKKAAKQAEVDQADLKHKCMACDAVFPSKTQLFQHIKDFGHAAPKLDAKGGGGGGPKKKGKRK
jgi:DnaJ family protein A protein 5